jgi:hypothetical protein
MGRATPSDRVRARYHGDHTRASVVFELVTSTAVISPSPLQLTDDLVLLVSRPTAMRFEILTGLVVDKVPCFT